MPSSSVELHRWAEKKFGGIDDTPVRQWLLVEGYRMDRAYEWTAPVGHTWESISQDHKNAIVFLIEEWDYGGCNFTPQVNGA